MSWGTSGPLIEEKVVEASTLVDGQLAQREGSAAVEHARRDAELIMSALQSLVATAREGSTFHIGGHRNDDGSGNAYLNIAHVAP